MLSTTWETWETRNSESLKAVVGTVTQTHPALRALELIERLCRGIEDCNGVAISLALSLLNEDPRIPFGKSLKSRIARSLNPSPSTNGV